MDKIIVTQDNNNLLQFTETPPSYKELPYDLFYYIFPRPFNTFYWLYLKKPQKLSI